MGLLSKGKWRHDSNTLVRCHMALVMCVVAFQESAKLGKVNPEGQGVLAALARREPSAADPFMDRLFARSDFDLKVIYTPIADPAQAKEDAAAEEAADKALMAWIKKAVEDLASAYPVT